MKATLFGVPASHPTLAGELMLERKGIEVDRYDLVAAVHRPVLRGLGFDGITVPAVRLDGMRLQGTRTISRALDALVPEPPLFPADPERRDAVERAEAWGDEVLQPLARRLAWMAMKEDGSAVASYLEGARIGIPTAVAAATAAPIVWLSARLNRANRASLTRDLSALPGLLDRVDDLIEADVIGGSEPNAADFQIATSIRLLSTLDSLGPQLEG